jgi:hypothetical protein
MKCEDIVVVSIGKRVSTGNKIASRNKRDCGTVIVDAGIVIVVSD